MHIESQGSQETSNWVKSETFKAFTEHVLMTCHAPKIELEKRYGFKKYSLNYSIHLSALRYVSAAILGCVYIRIYIEELAFYNGKVHLMCSYTTIQKNV